MSALSSSRRSRRRSSSRARSWAWMPRSSKPTRRCGRSPTASRARPTATMSSKIGRASCRERVEVPGGVGAGRPIAGQLSGAHERARCCSTAASFTTAFFFSGRRRHTRWPRDWSSDVCSSDLPLGAQEGEARQGQEAGRGCLGHRSQRVDADAHPPPLGRGLPRLCQARSEERRVGKESRSPAASAPDDQSPASCPGRTSARAVAVRRRRSRLLFFFQAEDGIRGGHVTGVQTCALPIFLSALKKAKLVKGKKLGVDASVIEANASMRTLTHRLSGEAYRDYVKQLAGEAGVDPDDEER